MAKAKKRAPARNARKPTPARVSRTMAKVRPLRAEPAIDRRYEPGYRPPPRHREPWLDEGEPEVNG